ncbi:MAG: N-acetylmuramoyl-L-alanine amidase [Microthrixaceae bacterium]|nr:N-acetylmuramoyl-L-alanine amidase [Microthrixaceae bacterium]
MLSAAPAPRRAWRFAALLAVATIMSMLPMPGLEFAPVAQALSIDNTALENFGSRVVDDVEFVTLGEHDIEPFTLVAVAFDSEPKSPVKVRAHKDGEWGQWSELEVEPAEGPDTSSAEYSESGQAATTITTEPYIVAGGDGYEVSLSADDAQRSHVLLVRDVMQRSVIDSTSLADADTVGPDGMNPRSSWGAVAPKEAPAYASSVSFGVVHHSDSGNSYSQAQVPGIIRGIQAFHMNGRGWNDIGYNFVVDKYGGVWEGRGGGADRPVIGAHAAGFNSGSVGVMVLGDYTATAPSAAARESVARVIGWKLAHYDADPTASVTYTPGSGSPKYAVGVPVTIPAVVGHGDVGQTACPGLIRNYLSSIRTRAQDWKSWYAALLIPKGALESATGGSASVTIKGWAVDGSAPDGALIRASVGSQAKSIYTSIARSDIKASYGGNGKAGFSGTFTGVPPGMQSVCATVKGATGKDLRLGCQWVLVDDPAEQSPVGRFDYVVTTPGQIHARGWGLDPTSKSSLRFDLMVDGVVRWSSVANEPSSTVPWAYRSWYGTNRQFSAKAVAVAAGSHTVCVKGRDFDPGQDTLLDCKIVTVPAHTPGGVVETIGSSRAGKLDVTGWALDLESTNPVKVTVTVGKRTYTVTADRRRDDIAAKYPGYGSNHGFEMTVTADGGEQPYCVTATNIGGGSNGHLACGTVSIVK